jgi:xanthine dehydrogenase small subunit
MPVSFSQLFDVLAQEPAATLIAGGTDLGLAVTKRHVRFPILVSVERLPGLKVLQTVDGVHHIGAAVPLSDVEGWALEALPVMARMLRYFGSRQIKHRGTIGGNIVNASPIGDTPPVLLALDATIAVRGPDGSRSIPIDEFFLDYRQTALAPGEVVVRVEVPDPGNARVGAYKVSRRREMDISAVAMAAKVEARNGAVESARIAFGGMAATPARAAGLEAALLGRTWTEATVEGALNALDTDFSPIGDHRASAWYRSTVARNLVRGFFHETHNEPFRALPDRPLSTVVHP